MLLGLHLAETVVGSVLYDFRGRLGLDASALSALTLLLASAIVFTLAMRFTRTGYGELFHASPASLSATAVLLLPAVFALVPVLVLVATGLTDWLVAILPLSRWEEELFAGMAPDTVAAIVLVCVLAPVLEEMLFRGLILRGFLARYPRWPAIVLSALLFGAAHLNIYQFVVGIVIGVPLGWLYERTRSLLPCIALHAAYNVAVTWLEVQAGATGGQPLVDAPLVGWSIALVLGAAGVLWLARVLQPSRA